MNTRCSVCGHGPAPFCSWACESYWYGSNNAKRQALSSAPIPRSRLPRVELRPRVRKQYAQHRKLRAGERTCLMCQFDLVGLHPRTRFCPPHALERTLAKNRERARIRSRVRSQARPPRKCVICGDEGRWKDGRATCDKESCRDDLKLRHNQQARARERLDPNHHAKKRLRDNRSRARNRAIVDLLEGLDLIDKAPEPMRSHRHTENTMQWDKIRSDPATHAHFTLRRRVRAQDQEQKRKARERDRRRAARVRVAVQAAREIGLIDKNANIIETEK